MSQLTVFNNLVEELLNYLHDIVPEEKDKFQIRVYKNGLSLVKSANAKLVAEHFVFYAAPYTKHISERNDEYFMSENIDAFAFISDAQDKGQAKQDGLRLREIWGNPQVATPEVKDAIWSYMQKLLMLGFQITGMI